MQRRGAGHARLFLDGGQVRIADVKSHNGVRVNGQQLLGETVTLVPGDLVSIGEVHLALHAASDSPAAPSQGSQAAVTDLVLGERTVVVADPTTGRGRHRVPRRGRGAPPGHAGQAAARVGDAAPDARGRHQGAGDRPQYLSVSDPNAVPQGFSFPLNTDPLVGYVSTLSPQGPELFLWEKQGRYATTTQDMSWYGFMSKVSVGFLPSRRDYASIP